MGDPGPWKLLEVGVLICIVKNRSKARVEGQSQGKGWEGFLEEMLLGRSLKRWVGRRMWDLLDVGPFIWEGQVGWGSPSTG